MRSRFTSFVLLGVSGGGLLLAVACGAKPPAGAGEGSEGGASTGSGGSGPIGPEPSAASGAVIPQRVRRLTNAEYARSIQAVLSLAAPPEHGVPADSRQRGFTRNHRQIVDGIVAGAYQSVAETVAADVAESGLETLVPCASSNPTLSCASAFISETGAKIYRRPLTREEQADLEVVYSSGETEIGFERGIELALAAMLQSAGFLYLTELGGEAEENIHLLTPYEIASSISYLVSGGPPDNELLAAAAEGSLVEAGVREVHARRILGENNGQLVDLVTQWFGVDDLDSVDKNDATFPDFEGLRPLFSEEADNFTQLVFDDHGGSVDVLFNADFTVASQELSDFYGVNYPSGEEGPQQVSLASTNRRGLMGQGAFLSAHSEPEGSGPIFRGVTILERLLCVHMENPADLGIEVVPPPDDAGKTSREKFADHSVSPSCRSCHDLIDPLGFSFEEFDGVGRARAMENGLPIDTTGGLPIETDLAGDVAHSGELAQLISQTPEMKECFARNLVAYSAAGADEKVEEVFLEIWDQLSPEQQNDVSEVMVSYIASSNFIRRASL